MLALRKGSMEQILKENKRIVCFGAGALAEFMLSSYEQLTNGRELLFLDNNREKDGTFINFREKKIPIYSVEHFKILPKEDMVLIIVPVFFYNIIGQLDADPFFDGIEAYIYAQATSQETNDVPYTIRNTSQPLIPKTIHYCWFGGGEIPDDLKKIMESWKIFCPDYEIVRWDEANYDVKKNQYVREAYEHKKYAFVSDYARKDILYKYGGIYLDTDVEIKRNMEDLRYNHAFVGMDDVANIGSGAGMGAVAGLPIIKELRDDYNDIVFIRPDGSINRDVSGINETRLLIKKGFRQKGVYQMVDQLSIFPRDVFLPVSWCGLPDLYTENTYLSHQFQQFVYGYTLNNVDELREKMDKLLARCE